MLIPDPDITDAPTVETPARKTKRCCCRKLWASQCGCSGCAPTTCSGRRIRPLHFPMFKSRSTTKKIAAYQIDHYMPPMQDDRPIGAVLAGLPTMPAPNVHSDFITSTINNISDPWVYAPVPNVAEHGHGTFQVGRRLRRSRSACAITVCARRCSSSRITRANWRSAKLQPSRARTPCSSASTTPVKNARSVY